MTTNLIFATFSFFLSSIFHWNKVKWSGLRPSRAIQIRMKKKASAFMKRGVVLNYFDLKEFGEVGIANFYYNKTRGLLLFGQHHEQNVQLNTVEDMELLTKSFLTIFPHEVMQVRVMGSSKQIFKGKIRHGKLFSVGNIESIKRDIHATLGLLRRSGELPLVIEIAHTHPSYETFFTDGESSSYLINALSESDQNVGRTLSEFLDASVVVRAISPSGVNYSRNF